MCSHPLLSRTAQQRNLLIQHWKLTLPPPPFPVDLPSHQHILTLRELFLQYIVLCCLYSTANQHRQCINPKLHTTAKVLSTVKRFNRLIQPIFLRYRQRKWKLFQSVWGYLLPPGILTFLQLNITVRQGCLNHIGEFILLQLALPVIFTTLQLFQPVKQRC